MHLSPDQVSSYLGGALSDEETATLEGHIDGCAQCRELISETVRSRYDEHLALANTQVTTSEPPLPITIGDVIDGRYRVERLLGVGGMGCVYEALHQALNQRVALKFMLPKFARDQSAVDRFTREARAAVRLVTEHVGRVLDLGALPDGTPFLVMELLVGETVEHRLLREGPFPRRVALEVIAATLDALHEAHALGIIHRDLKPANLFLARRSSGGEVLKVLDFGVAKSVHPDIEAGLGSTSAATLVGSPLYMAPEQLSPGRAIDPRADLWAVGCTLYQVLTGKTPFEGNDLVELMYSIQTRPHVPLAQLRPGLDDVSALVDECLAKEPHRRPSVAEALKRRVEALLAPPVAPPRPIVAAAQPSRRWPFAIGALVAVVGLALVATRPWVEPSQTPPAVDVTPRRPKPVPLPLVVVPPVEPAAVVVDAGALAVATPTPAPTPTPTRPTRPKPTPVTPVTPPPTTPPPTPPPDSVLDERL